MKRIRKYASSSSLMDVKITYGDETFSFNLFEELVVDENKINQEIKEQPSSFAFLAMLHKKLLRTSKDKRAEMDKAYARAYIQYKKRIDPETQRQYPKESAKELATKSPIYQKAIRIYHQAEEDWGVIDSCVKGFEQRKDLIQTLSANIRKTN